MVVNRMKSPIESDGRGVTAVVDEAIDGTKAIPMVLVTKNAEGLFEYASGGGGAVGADGLSAYEVAVKNGFVGTEADWLTSLKGATGAQGPQGLPGKDGADGSNGKSAYELAVAGGYSEIGRASCRERVKMVVGACA